MSKPSEATQRLDEMVDEFVRKTSLDSWNHFIEGIQVPTELLPALITNRPELLKLVPIEDYKAAQVKVLVEIIANLMETNEALRNHANQVAILAERWNADLKGMRRTAFKIFQFASFRRYDEDVDYDDFD